MAQPSDMTASMVDDLRRLVEVESPSLDAEARRAAGDELIAIVQERLAVAPVEHHQEDNRHLLWQFGEPGEISVLLVGHIDTVFPIGELAKHPFTVDDNGIARGSGVYDMKSGLVQAVHAVALLDDPSGVALLVNDDEEVGSLSSQALIADVARDVTAALVFEGATNGDDGYLKIARRGVSIYEIHVHGRAAHAGLNPGDGANALLELAHLALPIAAMTNDAQGITVTPTVAQAGTAINVIPDHAVLRVDVRAVNAEDQGRIDSAIRALEPTIDGTTIEVTGGPNRPPMPESAAAGLFDIAKTCAHDLGQRALGGAPVGGGSDASFIAPLGVPVIDGLGGVGGGAHQPDEWCDTTQMADRAELVAAMIERIRNGALESGVA